MSAEPAPASAEALEELPDGEPALADWLEFVDAPSRPAPQALRVSESSSNIGRSSSRAGRRAGPSAVNRFDSLFITS
jgi:hypothetical protein